MIHKSLLALSALGVLSMISTASPSYAANDGLAASVRHIQSEWERIKFTVPEGAQQTQLMNALGDEADKIAADNPNKVEAQIWDGIVTSERASLASAFSALGLAKRARDVLVTAYKLDPAALDAGATTSLGVLYYRVPGFPIGFGDKKQARQLLEEGTKLAPQGMDAWYFYGDFLMNEGEAPKAAAAFQHALAIPVKTDRPNWDKNRRLMIQQDLQKLKSAS